MIIVFSIVLSTMVCPWLYNLWISCVAEIFMKWFIKQSAVPVIATHDLNLPRLLKTDMKKKEPVWTTAQPALAVAVWLNQGVSLKLNRDLDIVKTVD